MAKIITSALWSLKDLGAGFTSLGIALLVLSMFLVPSSGLRADDGDGPYAAPPPPPPPPRVCDHATCDNGCFLQTGNTCSGAGRGYFVCNKTAACTSCPCKGCFFTGMNTICGCHCNDYLGGCSAMGMCN